jgi:putative membrane protein
MSRRESPERVARELQTLEIGKTQSLHEETLMRTVATFAVLLILAAGFAAAADKDVPLPDSDAKFLVEAVTSSNMEMRLSEHASRNASDPKVKEFADRMVKDHKELNARLAEQAKNLKVAVLAGQEEETRTKLDQLGKLKGADYDREYMRMMVEDHEKALKLFEGYGKTAKDDGLKTFTNTAATEIKKHLEEAKKIQADLKK